ncbi:FmdB family transcriptional regulator [Halothiobacillus diazotrophicus]|uniref:FmdB family transcriptional regulator n=1 Tax=Halothiobacillus diazotrophicus TaxID=1860122 RepID=A0A191ZED2_9GAMM|nr:zinc ribbon domain-containing protein [Halothiobacillus diazotrophicus]ANJ66228.1 FmdB family transcriptional regulator [Halothiobacillus diazotrophicus]
MPLFDYHCTACDKTFELLVFSGEIPTCPTCGSTELEKQISLPAPQGKSGKIIAAGRQQAAKEGHFSNYKSSELKGKL